MTVTILALLLAACQNEGQTLMPAQTPVAPAATAAPMASVASSAAAPARLASTASISGEAQVNQSIAGLLGDPAAYRRVFDALQQAVARQDGAAVAALVNYPITLTVEGNPVVVRDSAKFAALYGKFMTPAMAKAITQTRFAGVMVNSQGVMLGDGQAWLSGVCRDSRCAHSEVKVTALQPGPAPGGH
ncbi:MAG: hypothetical protein ABI227_01670 [Rhodanobacter sp.]